MRTLRLVAVLSSAILPSLAHAQQPSSPDTVLRAGKWAAEVGLGASNGASLLRFWSAESAVLLGADFDVTHYGSNVSGPGVSGLEGTSTAVIADSAFDGTGDLRPRGFAQCWAGACAAATTSRRATPTTGPLASTASLAPCTSSCLT